MTARRAGGPGRQWSGRRARVRSTAASSAWPSSWTCQNARRPASSWSGQEGPRVVPVEQDQVGGAVASTLSGCRSPVAGHQLILGPSATNAQGVEYAAQLPQALLQLLDGFSEREVRRSRQLACDGQD